MPSSPRRSAFADDAQESEVFYTQRAAQSRLRRRAHANRPFALTDLGLPVPTCKTNLGKIGWRSSCGDASGKYVGNVLRHIGSGVFPDIAQYPHQSAVPQLNIFVKQLNPSCSTLDFRDGAASCRRGATSVLLSLLRDHNGEVAPQKDGWLCHPRPWGSGRGHLSKAPFPTSSRERLICAHTTSQPLLQPDVLSAVDTNCWWPWRSWKRSSLKRSWR